MIAPVFEEAVFRGFIFKKLRMNLSTRSAAWVSGAIFAFMHLDLSSLIPLTVLGYILARVYEASDSLLTSILLHSAWNGMELLAMISVFGR